ncbi:MAG: hypothetical protein RIE32_13695 [Phycisphaerales bacterium]
MTRLHGEGAFVLGPLMRDDRGRRVREMDEAARARVEGSAGPGLLGWLLFFAMVAVSLKLWRWGETQVAGTAGWAFGGVIAVAAMVAVAAVLSISTNHRRRARWLERGACPGCGAPLARSKTGKDDVRVCGRCDAAWRTEDGRPAGRARVLGAEPSLARARIEGA